MQNTQKREYLGSIRRVDCVEAEVVLASGIYLVFRLAVTNEPTLRNLIEVNRMRKGVPPRTMFPIDGILYGWVRRGVLRAILEHRAKMHLPERVRSKPDEHFQLSLKF